MAMQRAVLARAAAEQELTNAQRRAAEAEQLADAAIQAKKDAGGGGQPKGIHEYELIYNIGEGASAQVRTPPLPLPLPLFVTEDRV